MVPAHPDAHHTLRGRASDFLSRRIGLLRASGWSAGTFVIQQVIRLGTNIVLAYLLSPALLGTMLLINTLRTGGELLTDVGIGQSIVNHKKGEEPSFYNTAWTIQVGRGFILFAISVLITWPIAEIYDDDALKILFPVAALMFILDGFVSPSRFLLQRRVDVKTIAVFTTFVNVTGSLVLIALAMIMQSIWALIIGLLLQGLIKTAASFLMLGKAEVGFHWDRSAVRDIINFGKWVFLSTVVFFAASNFDRLYLADVVPFAVLGVYGIARTFSDAFLQLFQFVSAQIVFPKVSTSQLREAHLAERMRGLRRGVIWFIAITAAAITAIGDAFIELVYDERYAAAALYLPILLAGSWFGTLSAIAESILMGISKPSNVAMGNAAKFLSVLVLVPPILTGYGMLAAVFIFAGVEIIRWLILTWRLRAHGLGFFGQDILATAGFLIAALVLRELTGLVGMTSGVAGWIEIAKEAFA